MPWIITAITASYLLGSIPTAYIFGRMLKGIDIRKFGSGNVGATNALRVLGKGPGITVLILDVIKGILPVVVMANFILAKSASISEEYLRIILGISCIAGHNWTVFLQFKGGKGIATTLGVLIGLTFEIPGLKIILSLLILTWVIIFAILRIVSIASVIAGISLPLYMLLFKQSKLLVLSSSLLTFFVLLRHKSNLRKFFRREEKRLF